MPKNKKKRKGLSSSKARAAALLAWKRHGAVWRQQRSGKRSSRSSRKISKRQHRPSPTRRPQKRLESKRRHFTERIPLTQRLRSAVKKLKSRPETGWVKRWQVPSETSPGTVYTVAIDTNGNYGCSCPVWKFSRKQCKHIERVRMQERR